MNPVATLALMSGLLNILLALWVWSLIRQLIDEQRKADKMSFSEFLRKKAREME